MPLLWGAEHVVNGSASFGEEEQALARSASVSGARGGRPGRRGGRADRAGSPTSEEVSRGTPRVGSSRSSKYRGVSWHKHRRMWQAHILPSCVFSPNMLVIIGSSVLSSNTFAPFGCVSSSRAEELFCVIDAAVLTWGAMLQVYVHVQSQAKNSYHLGYFANEVDAAKAYDREILKVCMSQRMKWVFNVAFVLVHNIADINLGFGMPRCAARMQ